MTTSAQKEIEAFYSNRAAKLLGCEWDLKFGSDELDWPDLIVLGSKRKFGLEIRMVYPDEARHGSRSKQIESFNIKAVKNIVDKYYGLSFRSIKVNFIGDIYDENIIVSKLVECSKNIADFEQKRIEPYLGCVAYVTGVPETLGIYRRWLYVSDRVGFVGLLDQEIIQQRIVEKSLKLEKYKKNIEDVRLLLVVDKDFNSGKIRLEGDVFVDLSGFEKVYLMLYPDSIYCF